MSSAAPVAIAVIGFSGVIGKKHVSDCIANQATELVALVDPSPAAAPVAAGHAVPYFPTVQAMLASETVKKPQAAIICTPNHTHVAVAKELASAGIHVLIEKPMSISAEEGQDLLQHLKKCGVRALVGHNRRFNDYVVATKKVLDEGQLGDVTAVSALWTLHKPLSYFSGSLNLAWRSSRSTGGGPVMINLIHEVDLLQYFFGPIIKVHAEKTISRRKTEGVEEKDRAEEGAAVILRFESGVVGTLLVSDHVVSPHNYEGATRDNPNALRELPEDKVDIYRIFGTDGALSIPDMVRWSYEPGSLKAWQDPLKKETVSVTRDPRDSFVKQLDHFVQLVRGEVEPSCSAEDGLRAVQGCEMITRAIDSPNGTVSA